MKQTPDGFLVFIGIFLGWGLFESIIRVREYLREPEDGMYNTHSCLLFSNLVFIWSFAVGLCGLCASIIF